MSNLSDPGNLLPRLVRWCESQSRDCSNRAMEYGIPQWFRDILNEKARFYTLFAPFLRTAQTAADLRSAYEWVLLDRNWAGVLSVDLRTMYEGAAKLLYWAAWWMESPNQPMPRSIQEKLHGF